MVAIAKLRPAVKWHGGEAYLARRIVALLPDHDRYVEPYAGGLSVLLDEAGPDGGGGRPRLGPDEFLRRARRSAGNLLARLEGLEYGSRPSSGHAGG